MGLMRKGVGGGVPNDDELLGIDLDRVELDDDDDEQRTGPSAKGRQHNVKGRQHKVMVSTQ